MDSNIPMLDFILDTVRAEASTRAAATPYARLDRARWGTKATGAVSFLPPLTPTFEAALRDAKAARPEARRAACGRLAGATAEERTDARDALSRLAEDPAGPVREAAIEALGHLGGVESVPQLLDHFTDEDRHVRAAAITAAGRTEDPRIVEPLVRALASEHAEVRIQAARSLSACRPRHAVAQLPALLNDGDPHVRAGVAEILGELGEPATQDALGPRLEDPHPDVRRAAAVALARFGDGRGRSILREALWDELWVFEAADGLALTSAQEARDELALLATRWRSPLLSRAAAAGALIRLGDERGARTLGRVLRAWRADARSYAAELIGTLGVVELAEDLARLAERPRGVDPVTLARALTRLAPHSVAARRALQRLALREDEAGTVAREGLSSAGTTPHQEASR